MPQAATAAAAAPTLAGVAAAICLSPQAPAQAAVAPAGQATPHHAIVPAAYRRAPSVADLMSATRHATSKPKTALPTSYTVQPGDSLSAIAGRFYHDPAAWPVIYWGNRDKIRWANIIDVGQVLYIPAQSARIPKPPSQLAPPVQTTAYAPRHARADSAPADSVVTTAADSSPGYDGEYPGGAFGACVVERESGGDPDIWNASGHWGLYQFSESTWIEYGGDPALFGDATVAEQNAVFATALADGGEYNWAPYDGC